MRRTATPRELFTLLYSLPKGGDLHNHLVGAFLPEQWYRAATDPKVAGRANYYVRMRHGAFTPGEAGEPSYPYESLRESAWRALPDADRGNFKPLSDLTAEEREAWLSLYKIDKPGEGRYTFFGASPRQRLRQMGQDPALLSELLVDSMKLYGAEGVHYLEFQAPPFGLVTPDGTEISEDDAAEIYEAALRRPDAIATGVEVRFLITALRFAPDAEEQVKRIYRFIDRHHSRWVGINLAGIEERDQGNPLRFLQTFREMRRKFSNVGISIHAGEMDGPNSHVRDTLLLGATRIGHGVTLIKDPDTLLLMRDRQWLVEVNLISNRVLEYTPDLDQHPFPEYLRIGVPVCLNTDDRGWWHSTMTDEYFEAVTRYNLTWAEIRQIGRASIEHSFMEPTAKARVLAAHEKALDAFEQRVGSGDWRSALKDVKPVTFGYAARHFGLTFP
ncbi:MAG: adenosine deaminase [Opitutus sp.]